MGAICDIDTAPLTHCRAELEHALRAISSTAQRVNTDKGKSDDFAVVQDLCTQTLADSYICRVLSHPSQKSSGRRLIQVRVRGPGCASDGRPGHQGQPLPGRR